MRPTHRVPWLIAASLATALFLGGPTSPSAAAPGEHPFAGTYAGQLQETVWSFAWGLTITISPTGKIEGVAYYYAYQPGGCAYRETGVHTADGSVSTNGSARLRLRDDCHRAAFTLRASLDAGGNLLLTSDEEFGLTSTLTRL